ncbi:MAG: hypothetical protein ACREQQ_09065 [Candidatus Binatia bacterium]
MKTAFLRTTISTLLVSALLAGCSTSTSARPQALASRTSTAKVSGSACGLDLLDLIPIGVWTRRQRAYNDALAGAGAKALITPTVRDTRVDLVFATLKCSAVEGTAVF